MAEHADVVVVGGSQAGLVAGYHLKRAGIPFLILDAGYQVGQAWRSRWDSLTLFTTARYSTLPGLDFPGHPEHFPNKDEMADYLARYAHTFQLPIRLDTKVTALTAADGGYRADTDSGVYHAAAVIVATGAYQRPHLPAISEKLAPDVFQVHSARYRNPRQIPDREVLVVGAANSGAGIAEDLAATHRVTLSQGSQIPHLPRRLVGKSLHFWGDRLGLIGAPLDSWRGRTQRGELLVGPGLRTLARRHRIHLASRTIDAQDRTLRFADGSQLDVDAVVWATGYRTDYSWIQLPVLDPTGAPIHRRGITDHPGLYFLGMKHQHSRGSALIHWVTHDAAYLVDDIRTQRASNHA
jgi:putative flavoprotein involved in K+ transport